jgi:transketolase C-terminal domain/subunit
MVWSLQITCSVCRKKWHVPYVGLVAGCGSSRGGQARTFKRLIANLRFIAHMVIGSDTDVSGLYCSVGSREQ